MSGIELLGAASTIVGIIGAAAAISSSVHQFFKAPEVVLFRDGIHQFTLTWPALERILIDQEPHLHQETWEVVRSTVAHTTEVLQQTKAESQQFVRDDDKGISRTIRQYAYTYIIKDPRRIAGQQSTKRWKAFFQRSTIQFNRQQLENAHRHLTLVFNTLK
jgi:hypothetical protein